jgi:single-strand DNA-binding protein
VRTEWHSIFGVLAETCAKYLHKGRQIFVEGRSQSQRWKDKDGDDRYSHQVVANVIQFLGPKPKKDIEPEPNAETFIAQMEDQECDDIPW